MLKCPKHLRNLHEKAFIKFFDSSEDKMIWKISPWLKFKILGVFVNTLTADNKYPVRDCGDLQFPIQMQLF